MVASAGEYRWLIVAAMIETIALNASCEGCPLISAIKRSARAACEGVRNRSGSEVHFSLMKSKTVRPLACYF